MDLLQDEAAERNRSNGLRRVIFESHTGAGDITVLTGALRDLHARHPRTFAVDVRTSYPELWFYNPHLTHVGDHEDGVERVVFALKALDTKKPRRPALYFDVFLHDLREQLGVELRPTRYGGDIHLSPNERLTPDPVAQLLGSRVPYWIIGAGGKYDLTAKWWDSARYQSVVDYFRDRILFVQVGAAEHRHPPLRGVLDLRGRTSMRELVRLMYGSQGVLCGVTLYMHLAAGVPTRFNDNNERPCVVVAGAREPQLLTQYPGHQFIHNVGTLPCSNGGCWKARTKLLNDGSGFDLPEHLCTNLAGELPRCMDLITAADVIRRIEGFFEGGATEYLQGYQIRVARRVDRSRARQLPGMNMPEQTNPVVAKSLLQSPGGLFLLTGADERMREVAEVSGHRLEEYALRHGYRSRRVTLVAEPPRGVYWAKISAVLQAMNEPGVEWVGWFDADAIILNQDMAAADLLRSDADVVVASDQNATCVGIFFVRVCPWSRRFFETIQFLGPVGYVQDWVDVKQEQTTWRYLVKTFPELQPHVYLVEQHVMNSYVETYQPGDFVLHLGGLDNEARLRIMQQAIQGISPVAPFNDDFFDGRS